ncbi:hypothetical protein QFZ27_004481 [Inquilinus ginsengisoli]|uniref:phage tail tip lysozyme n=1 Tax=Inquilinus ginsengisoli TaxID=363840 RepID=UPI003D1D1506
MAIPTINAPRVAPADQRLPYGRSSADPAAFGALEARALGGLGEGIQRAAAQASNIVISQASLANDSMGRDLVTSAEQGSLDAFGKYSMLNGQDAVAGLDAFQADLRQQQSQTLAAAPNDAVRRSIKPILDQQFTSLTAKAAQHARQQNQAWAVASATSAAQSSATLATSFAADPSLYSTYLSNGIQDIANLSRRLGEDPETAAIRRRQYIGNTVAASVGVMLGDGDPLGAAKLFEAYRGEMMGEDAARIGQTLRPQVLDARADQIVSTAMAGGTPRGVNSSPVSAMAFQHFRAAGYPEPAARALVGQIMAESGGNPGAVGDGGTAFGLMQWRGDRRAALEAFAAQKGTSPADIGTQLEFATYELAGSEASAGSALKNATDLPAALDAAIGFERPAGWSAANPRGGHNYEGRAQYARDFDPGALPDRQSATAQILAQTAGDPDLQRVSLSRLNSAWAANEIAYGVDRSQLAQTVKETDAALTSGLTVPIPEQQIRATLPPVEAEQVIGGLKNAQIAGQLYQSIKFAAPADVAQMRADLADGTGPLTAAIRSNLGLVTDPTTDLVPATSQAREFAARQDILKTFDQQADRRAKAMTEDPAGYAVADPTVRAAAATLEAQPTPENWARYATATTALQERIGVPPGARAILPNARRQQILGRIATMDPKTVADYMAGLKASMGIDVWAEAFADLQRGPGGLPSQFVALGLINDMAARTTLTNVLQQEMTKPGVVKSALEDAVSKSIDTKIESDLAEFIGTFSVLAGGQAHGAAFVESAKLLAYGLATQGMGESAAARRAVAAIAGQYDVMVSTGMYNALAPAGFGSHMAEASDVVRSRLTAADLATLPDRSGLYYPEDIDMAARNNARWGLWVTSPSGDGWTLVGADGAVARRRNGQPVALTYDEARAMATVHEFVDGVDIGTPIEQAKRQRLLLPEKLRAPPPSIAPFGFGEPKDGY